MVETRKDPNTSFTRPHPEALYFHIAQDNLNLAQNASDPFARAQAVATTLVFSALCLEAYANQRLHDLELGALEALPLEAKWRALPRLAGTTFTFDRGRMPYQGFKKLVKLRNSSLVHFHPEEEIHQGLGQPIRPFYSEMFHDLVQAESAVDTVREMITVFRSVAKLPESAPDFLAGARYTTYAAASRNAVYESLGEVRSQRTD